MMLFPPQPWQLYFVILAGWVHRQQQYVIEYLIAENKVPRETHGKRDDDSSGGRGAKMNALAFGQVEESPA